MTESHDHQPGQAPERPVRPAMLRGWRRKCPRCGTGPMMRSYLQVQRACPACGEELHHHRADDGPAYLTILIVGHLMAPLILWAFVSLRPDPLTAGGCLRRGLRGAVALPAAAAQGGDGGAAMGQAHARLRRRQSGLIRTRMEDDGTPIRDAATVILVRDRDSDPRILMGQRGTKAVFMPSKFVFPGGAVDPADRDVPLAGPADPDTMARLAKQSPPELSDALLAAAIRELWEETGLVLGRPGQLPDGRSLHDDWTDFLATGAVPSGEGLTFIFRAITPPGRTRRFDARFFLADAEKVMGDPDDFSRASDELSHLHWTDLDAVRDLSLPFITEVVLAELHAILEAGGTPESVPFVYHRDGRSYFDRL